MNFKRQLLGPEVPTPQMFDDVVKDREIAGGDLQIKGFTPQALQQSSAPSGGPVPVAAASLNGNRHVFPLSNRTNWNPSPTKFRVGPSDD